MKKTIENYLSGHNDVIVKVVESHTDTIVQIAQAIVESFKNDGKLILFGNGGSAQDAQHIAAELVGIYTMERRSLPAIALSTNTSVLTALPNDYYYHSVFERQVEGIVYARVNTRRRSNITINSLQDAIYCSIYF